MGRYRKPSRKMGLVVFVLIAASVFLWGYNIGSQQNVSAASFSNTAAVDYDIPVLHGPYDVTRVVDGDTIVVNIGEMQTKVRFIGVDTPESVNPDENKNTEAGVEASEYTKRVLQDKRVYLEYDISSTDKYGRTLAYVYLDDGKTMVNRLLLDNGLAVLMTVQPNSRYADEFYQIQVSARNAGAGFWGTGLFAK